MVTPPNELITTHITQVQFRDLDPLTHVNNAVYLSWMEDARVAFLKRWGLAATVDDIDFVVARAEVDFILPVFEQEKITVWVWASRIGNKSIDLRYALFAAERMVAQGLTVLVSFDRELRQGKPLPGGWRTVVEPQVDLLAEFDPPRA